MHTYLLLKQINSKHFTRPFRSWLALLQDKLLYISTDLLSFPNKRENFSFVNTVLSTHTGFWLKWQVQIISHRSSLVLSACHSPGFFRNSKQRCPKQRELKESHWEHVLNTENQSEGKTSAVRRNTDCYETCGKWNKEKKIWPRHNKPCKTEKKKGAGKIGISEDLTWRDIETLFSSGR